MVVPPRPDSHSDMPPTFVVRRDHALVEVHVGPGFGTPDGELERWVTRAVDGVGDYFGRYLPPNVYLDLRPITGHEVGFGTAYGGRAPWAFVELGADTGVAALDADWVLVHELIHLASPHLEDQHRWAMEGLATFVEPFIRLHDGTLSREDLWRRFVQRMPAGQPEADDRGLDHTPTWGRTYWGGALFWLVAEVTLRRAHAGTGLRTGLRAVAAQGGDKRGLWPMDKLLSQIDEATEGSVLVDLWQAWRATPVEVDLDALWGELGIELRGGDVVLKPSALREAIEGQGY